MSVRPLEEKLATLMWVWATTLLPSVNAMALIGAFAGSTVYAMEDTEASLPKKFFYTLISLLMGYFVGPAVADAIPYVPGHDILGSAVVSVVAIKALTGIRARAEKGELPDFSKPKD